MTSSGLREPTYLRPSDDSDAAVPFRRVPRVCRCHPLGENVPTTILGVPGDHRYSDSWIDGFGAEIAASAVVKDISAGGFCIEAVYQRPTGSRPNCEKPEALDAVRRSSRQSRNGWFYHGLQIVPLLVERATDRRLIAFGSVRRAINGRKASLRASMVDRPSSRQQYRQ